MVGGGARDDGVPDDGTVGLVRGDAVGGGGRGPLGCDVDEELLGVPGKERGQVGVEGKLYYSIFLFLRAVVVRPALHSASC